MNSCCKSMGRMLVAVLSAAFAAGSTFAAELPACSAPISFALYESGALYDSQAKSGIDKDFALELERRSKCTFALQLKPRARIWHELEAGELMSTGSGIQNATREQFAWGIRYLAVKHYVVVRNEAQAGGAAPFLASKQWKWGAVRGFRHGEDTDAYLQKLRDQGRVLEESDSDKLFKLLSKGQVQAIFADQLGLDTYIRQYGLGSEVRAVDWFPEEKAVPLNFMLSRKHFSEKEVDKWRSLVRGMRKDGTLERIMRQHLGANAARQVMQFTPND